MTWLALRMLLYDKVRSLALVTGVTIAAVLIAQQSGIFYNLMATTAGPIAILDAPPVWVMGRRVQSVDTPEGLRAAELTRVRGVAGVAWAVPLLHANAEVRSATRPTEAVQVFGLDDDTMTGLPTRITAGRAEDLRGPGAIMLDRAGFARLFPGEPIAPGRAFEIGGTLVRVAGIIDSPATFYGLPMVFARLSLARTLAGGDGEALSYVLALPAPGVSAEDTAARIAAATGLKALTGAQFRRETIGYYLRVSGIAENFGVTILVGLLAGATVVGQTFYMFATENLKHFAALKAIGVTNRTILGMVLLQALYVGAIGLALGLGIAAGFFVLLDYPTSAFRAMTLPGPIAAGTAATVFLMMAGASLVSARRLLAVDAAIVFRG